MTGMTAEGFAGSCGSYWSSILPRLDHFVRITNAGPKSFDDPIRITPISNRQSFVSETGFYLWAMHESGMIASPRFLEAQDQARRRLRTLAPHLSLLDDLDEQERFVAMTIAQRIDSYCSDIRNLDQIEVEPRLPGCGWISGGLPDIVARDISRGTTRPLRLIAEVKCVDRNYRSVDLRQIVCYLVLHFAHTRSIPDLLAVINPLRGTSLEIGVDEFFEDVVGSPAADVINELLVEWSSAGVSP